MSEVNQVEKTLGAKLAELLKRKPQHYNVTFSVGPDKIKVEAVKIILEAVSPVFEREFEDKWDNVVVKEDEGIPLPDVDPIAFKLFVNFITSDSWTVDALNSLQLHPNALLNLLGLCRRFEITDAIKNVEKATRDLILSFRNVKDTDELFNLSRENLESIFSCEEIPLDEKEIFECACRWAEFRCKENKMEPTGENIREVLGGCLFEIRFPTMKFQEFTKVSLHKKNVLAYDMKLAIYDYIGMEEAEKAECNKTKILPFNTIPRVPSTPFGCSLLRMAETSSNPNLPFLCNGNTLLLTFQVNQKIELHGVGFLGPIDEDTLYDVTVKIISAQEGSCKLDSGVFKKNIFARKQKVFHFFFDEAITVESNAYDSNWRTFHQIAYTLRGANSVSQLKMESSGDKKLHNSDAEFYLFQSGSGGTPLAELVYKKV